MNSLPADIAALDTNGNGVLDADDDSLLPYWPGDDVVDWSGLSLCASLSAPILELEHVADVALGDLQTTREWTRTFSTRTSPPATAPPPSTARTRTVATRSVTGTTASASSSPTLLAWCVLLRIPSRWDMADATCLHQYAESGAAFHVNDGGGATQLTLQKAW